MSQEKRLNPSEVPLEVTEQSARLADTLPPMQEVFAGSFAGFEVPSYDHPVEVDTLRKNGFGAFDQDTPPGFGAIFPANSQVIP